MQYLDNVSKIPTSMYEVPNKDGEPPDMGTKLPQQQQSIRDKEKMPPPKAMVKKTKKTLGVKPCLMRNEAIKKSNAGKSQLQMLKVIIN